MAETKTKQPRDVLDWDEPFTRWFPEGDTITMAEAEVEPAGDLVVESVQFSGRTVKVWLSGGTDGITYKVSVMAATSGGRQKETEFKLRVRDT